MMPSGLAPAVANSTPVRSGADLGEVWAVHGMLEDETCWEELAQALDAPALVRPHFPWSAKSGQYWGSENDGAGWVQAFAQERQAAPRIVVCHSFGCNAVLEWLLHRGGAQPEILVLVSPFYRSSRDDIRWDTLMGLAGGLERLIGESIAAQDRRGRYTGWLLDDMVTRVRDRLGLYGWAEFLNMFLRSPTLPLHLLRSRTLVVSGVQDHYSEHESNGALAAAIPGASHLRIAEGGHFIQKTHADTLASAILAIATGNRPTLS